MVIQKWELSEYERGYMESVLDAEGYIGITRHCNYSERIYYQPDVSVVNTNVSFLQKIGEICRDGGSICQISEETEKHKAVYKYSLTHEAIPVILSQLDLVIKEDQKQAVLDLITLIHARRGYKLSSEQAEWRKSLWQYCKRLNKKGPSIVKA